MKARIVESNGKLTTQLPRYTQGQFGQTIRFKILNNDNTVFDLTNFDVQLNLELLNEYNEFMLQELITITDSQNGICEYTFSEDELFLFGSFNCFLKVYSTDKSFKIVLGHLVVYEDPSYVSSGTIIQSSGTTDNLPEGEDNLYFTTQRAIDAVTDQSVIENINHDDLVNTGSNSHQDIDNHISDSSIHFIDSPADGKQYVRKDNGWEEVDVSWGGLSGDQSSVDLSGFNNDLTITENKITDLDKYTQQQVNNLLNDKVDNTDFNSHTGDSTIHFTQEDISITENQITDLDKYTQNEVNNLLNDKVDNTDFNSHTGDSTIHFTQNQIEISNNQVTGLGTASTRNVGTSNGNLVEVQSNGKISENVIPSIALTEVYTVADDTARDNLTVETGDIAIVDNSAQAGGEPATYIYDGTIWQKLKSPTDAVSSVFGRTGTVTAQSGDYSFNQINGTIVTNQIEDNQVTYGKLSSIVQNSLDLADSAFSWGDHSVEGYLKNINGLNVSDLNNDEGYITSYTVTEGDVTQHQGALTITESQISDLGNYIETLGMSELTDYNVNNNRIINITNPIDNQDAATKNYVDNAVYAGGLGDMLKTVYDIDDNGIVDNAEQLNDEINVVTAQEARMHIDDNSIHFTQGDISITESQISDFGNYIEDAPADGEQYVRQNGDWEQIDIPSGSGEYDAENEDIFNVKTLTFNSEYDNGRIE